VTPGTGQRAEFGQPPHAMERESTGAQDPHPTPSLKQTRLAAPGGALGQGALRAAQRRVTAMHQSAGVILTTFTACIGFATPPGLDALFLV